MSLTQEEKAVQLASCTPDVSGSYLQEKARVSLCPLEAEYYSLHVDFCLARKV